MYILDITTNTILLWNWMLVSIHGVLNYCWDIQFKLVCVACNWSGHHDRFRHHWKMEVKRFMCDGLHIYAFYIGFQKHTPFSFQWLPPFMSTHIGDLLRLFYFILFSNNTIFKHITFIFDIEWFGLHLMLITFIMVLVCPRCVRI